jgi:hypothetical protein
MLEIRKAQVAVIEKPAGKDYFVCVGVNGKMIFKLIIRKYGVMKCSELSGSGQVPVAYSCGKVHEPRVL